MEINLNKYLRLIWSKKLIRNTLNHNLFPSKQLDNCQGLLGYSAPLLKVLKFDLISFFA